MVHTSQPNVSFGLIIDAYNLTFVCFEKSFDLKENCFNNAKNALFFYYSRPYITGLIIYKLIISENINRFKF